MSALSSAEKLRILLEYKGLSNLQQFAEEIGANKQNMYDIAKGKCNISKNMKERILARFPDISRDWLDDKSETIVASESEQRENEPKVYKESILTLKMTQQLEFLKKEIESLSKQLEEEKQRSAQYWELIQKLTK